MKENNVTIEEDNVTIEEDDIIIIRDWHLKKGDKVKHAWHTYTFQHIDWMYAKWLDVNWELAIGNFNYLIYDKEKEAYIPYTPNKK